MFRNESFKRAVSSCVAILISAGLVATVSAQDLDESPSAIAVGTSFEKHVLTTEYFAEGASVGDFNHDGTIDIVSGPYWYEGPDWTPHQFYEGNAFPNDRGYSDNFFSFVGDFNGDDWDDVLVVGLPGTPAHWYENPGDESFWQKRVAFPAVDNEAPVFTDVDGDGISELVCTYQGRLGYAKPHPESIEREWEFTPISEQGNWQRFSHGLGIGDVNGDQRVDYLMPEGWWEQPSDDESLIWQHHAHRFCPGGAQIYAIDFDGDGDADIATSQRAHAYGLSWFEQSASEDGATEFVEHVIMTDSADGNPEGVAFSQLHAIECVDVDGDGRTDIVAGKCYWAHNGGDPGARDPAVNYWFKNTETENGIRFVPHLIDDDSGVGRQIRVVDVNGDGRVDLITANKKGLFVFTQSSQ